VGETKDFQIRAQKIGELVQSLERIADPAAHSAAKELVQLVMDLHGAALERILEIVFQSDEAGSRLINEIAFDSLVSSLLILYGLHPDDLQTRVERKLEQIAPRLHKMGASVTLISAEGGNVRLRVSADHHACGSTTRSLRESVEGDVYDAAPDLASLTIEGLEEPAASGFVELEKLMGAGVAAIRGQSASHSEGLD
jgi:Fe-S cluster biogenesis protein NfuA